MEAALLAHVDVSTESPLKRVLTSVLFPQVLAPALKATFMLTQVIKIRKQVINKDNYKGSSRFRELICKIYRCPSCG